MEKEHIDPDTEFINELYKLQRNKERGKLANLRNGLGKKPNTVMGTYPVIYSLSTKVQDEIPYSIIAPLFAFYSEAPRTTGNFGSSVKQINDESQSIETRFVALLDADFDNLHYHLRQFVSMLKSKEKPINWYQLLKDIKDWERDDNNVQRNWARSFWGSAETNKQSEPQQEGENE